MDKKLYETIINAIAIQVKQAINNIDENSELFEKKKRKRSKSKKKRKSSKKRYGNGYSGFYAVPMYPGHMPPPPPHGGPCHGPGMPPPPPPGGCCGGPAAPPPPPCC